MLGRYLQVLRAPGALRFSAAGSLARLQMSMIGIGAVLLLSVTRDSFALAGAVSATYSLSAAVIGPAVSRQIDVRGQRRVVPVQLLVHVPAMVGFLVLATWTVLTWPLFLLAFVAGAAQPSIGPLVRTRWSALLSGSPDLRTAFAWESLIDEAVYIIGPPLATVLAQQLFPNAAMITATVFLLVGTALLLTQTGTEPAATGRAPRRQRSRQRPAVLLPGVAGLTLAMVLMGGLFGSFEVATIAFTKAAGHPGVAGLLLALYSVASLLAGLVFGGLRLRASLHRQYLVSMVALAVVTLPLPLMHHLVLVAAGLALAGVACSPVLIAGTSLLESIVPSGRLTEAMTWSNSGVAAGLAGGSAVAGVVIDAHGASAAYWVTSACAVGAFLIAVATARPLHRAASSAQVVR